MKHPCISPNFNFMGQLLQFQNERAAKKSDGSTPSSDHWEAQEDEREEEEEEDNVVLSLSAFTTASLPLIPIERGEGEEDEGCLSAVPNPPGGARAFAFEQARGEGCSILVHCRAGISRSATVVMAYLIQYYNKNMEEAFDFIKMKHPCISPNFNFMGQLLQFQNERAAKKSDGSTPSSDHWEAQEDEREEEEEEDNVVLSAFTTASLPLIPIDRGEGEEEEECLSVAPNPPGGARAFAFGE
eukprot:sb/3469028/